MNEKTVSTNLGSLATILATYDTIVDMSMVIESEELANLCTNLRDMLRTCEDFGTRMDVAENDFLMSEIRNTFGEVIRYLVVRAFGNAD